ncbi:MAG: M28 family peptidase [Gemmatimonadetes bacterium]|nr:M28 family peptidase [Gemmatimonadota bacterium]
MNSCKRSLALLLTAASLLVSACHSAVPGGPPVAARAPLAQGQALADAAGIARVARQGSTVAENAHPLIDVIGGRMSGQPSGDLAQEFVRGRLAGYGLEEVRLERFPLLGWERGPAALVLQAPEALHGREISVLSLGHVGAATVTAPVLDAGHGTAEELAALGDRARGRIVLVRVGQPEGYGRSVHRTEKLTLAAAAGAVGFVMIAPEPGTLVQVGVATLGDEPAPIPAVAANFETGSWLLRILASAPGPVVAGLTTGNRMGPAEAANVLGDLRGTSGETVLAGAHLDSWDLGTGALDNGSGTLVVMEAARILSAHVLRTGEQPRRTIRFALWMGEELGLYGSRFHVAEALRRGTLDEYRAVLNLDMVGAPVGFGAMDRPEAAAALRPLIHELRAAGFALDTAVATGGGLYSDHQPFLLEGIPILSMQSRLKEGAGRFYHSAGDTRDKIDEADLGEAAAAVAGLLWYLATAPDLPLPRWTPAETGRRLERMGLRDPLERGGEWRWE